MQSANGVLKKLEHWAVKKNSVRTMILIGSRANPNSYTDMLSDYDVELFVNNLDEFMNDEWLSFLGDIMIRWPLKPTSTCNKKWITRLVRFENGVRIDFQITAQKQVDPSDYDNGYNVLIDKDSLTDNLQEPTFSKYVIKKPSEEKYNILVNDFFWDATYVAKNLWRDELHYAKYMLDSIIRFEYLQKMTEWFIATQHNWSISTNKHGRLFKRYLDSKTWSELEKTFSDADIENNWKAFFNMIELFRRLAKEVARNLRYEYPENIDRKIIEYCKNLKEE